MGKRPEERLEVLRKGRSSGEKQWENGEDLAQRQWSVLQERLRRQRDLLKAAGSPEESTRVLLDSRAEHGTEEGEKPLSESAYFKREALLDKALDRHAKAVKELMRKTPADDNEMMREWQVVQGMFQDLPEFFRIFLERLHEQKQ